MVQYKRIGDMLLDAGLINQAQLDTALKTKMGTTLRFGEILTALGYATEEQVTECLAQQYGYKLADLTHVEPEQEAINLVPSITALSGLVLPVKLTDERFYCVIADPLDVPMTDSLFRLAGRPVEFSLAPPSELFDRILSAYKIGPSTKRIGAGDNASTLENKKRTNKRVGNAEPRPKRKVKIDTQDDRFALLAAYSVVMDKVA
ncbi:MAG: hypothetical protein JSS66_14230 [Armatimonadetes bacterium]|nr:hypothetical protein [Armatimonadota bacterium]